MTSLGLILCRTPDLLSLNVEFVEIISGSIESRV